MDTSAPTFLVASETMFYEETNATLIQRKKLIRSKKVLSGHKMYKGEGSVAHVIVNCRAN